MHLAAGGAIIWTMTDDKVKRRLTTVLCADVHGYSRLMEADEAGTLGTLRRSRTAIAGLVARHDGRIVNTWGDAVIAEFASVVEAVQCAVEIQQEISSQDPDPPQAHRMRFRIGINLGDVMVEGSDIYGDGVNIAARLQELAEPGGVVVSSTVYDQVHNKLSVGFDCLGQQPMKNVASVTSYRVTMSGGQAAGRRSLPADDSPPPRADFGRSRLCAVDVSARPSSTANSLLNNGRSCHRSTQVRPRHASQRNADEGLRPTSANAEVCSRQVSPCRMCRLQSTDRR
jgi:adenylate cyclase